MSLDHYHFVAKHSKAKGSARSVLNCIAVRANEDNKCWPSRADLANESGLTEKTVSGAIKELKELGELSVDRKSHGQIYTINTEVMLRCVTSHPESDVTDFPSDVTNTACDVTESNPMMLRIGGPDVTDLPIKESKDKYKDNIKTRKETHAHVTEPPEDFGVHLRFNKGVIQNNFGKNTEKIWPIAKAIQEHCDVPGWKKLEGNLFEIIGFDVLPTPSDVERIVKSARNKKPNDDFWPSNFVNVWRRELVKQKSMPSAEAETERKRKKNERIFKNLGIEIPAEVPF